MFDRIAKYYDLITGPFDYRELADCVDDLIISSGGKRTDLLDLGCGTSEELTYFSQLGYQISGIDISHPMIEISKNKMPGGYFEVRDMREFSFEKKFDNIISVFDTINYLTEPEGLLKCFKNVNNALNNNGLFLFDFNSVYGLINDWEGIKIEETEDFFISYDSQFDKDTKVLECNMKFFIKEEDGRFITFDEIHRERGYSADEIAELLKESGLRIKKILPFLSRRETQNKKLNRYQIVAQKKGEI